jgi:phage tail-like protein
MAGLSTEPKIPLQAARFIVRVEAAPGVSMLARFKSISELSVEVAKSEIWQGGSMIPFTQPARLTFADITLERGATNDAELFNWLAATTAPTPDIGGVGEAFKRTIDIVAQDRSHVTVAAWRLLNAWPVGYKPGEWDNESDDFLMESVTLTYDFFRPIKLAGSVAYEQVGQFLP